MKKEFIIYGMSIGINRGAILLLMPILVKILSKEDFGVYSYIQILMQLFAPIIGLNLFAAISREGGEDYRLGNYILFKTVPFILLATGLFAVLAYFFNHTSHNVLFWGIMLGGIEAIHNMQLNQLRCMNRHATYFIFSCLKTAVLLLLYLLLAKLNISPTLSNLLIIQVTWFAALLFLFQALFVLKHKQTLALRIIDAIKFSIVLVPHSLAQWLITGTGRFFIKEKFSGFKEVGLFSKAYNLSLVLMIINSGVGLLLPQYLIRDYKSWIQSNKKDKFFIYYSISAIAMYLLIVAAVIIDFKYFGILKTDFLSIAWPLLFNFLGFYFLGFYYYYTNILFVLRKTKVLSFITVLTSLFCIIVNYSLIEYCGIFGAAISVSIVYTFYLALSIYFSIRYEPKLKPKLKNDYIMIAACVILLCIITWCGIKMSK